MASSVDNIILVFTARGVQRVGRSIDALTASTARAQKGVVGLQGSLNALGALLAVRQVIAYADSYTELQNRLRLVTDTSEEVVNATQNIFDIASRTRGNIEETSRTYFRFARANERLGLSEKELLDITETVNQAVAFSGTSAQSASSALFQFSQGIAAGTLRGQELNSVLEQIPGLAEVLARGLKVGVDELRKLGEAGELTGKQIAQALLSQREFASEEFGQIVFTVSQEFEGLRTEVIRYIGEIDKATGASRALAEGIRFLALNVDLLAKGLAVVGALALKAFAPRIIAAARGLAFALAANPIGAFVLAISTLVTVMIGFRDEITLFKESGATLGTTLEVVFGKLKTLGVEAFEAAKKAGSQFFESITGQTPTAALNSLTSTITEGLNNNTSTLREWANIALGLLTLPVRGAIVVWQTFPAALGDILFTALEGLRTVLSGQFDWEGFWTGVTEFIADAFSRAFDFVVEKGAAAVDAIKNFSFEIPDIKLPEIDFSFLEDPLDNPFEGGIERFGAGLRDVIEETFNRDFVGETAAVVKEIKTKIIEPLLVEIAAAQKAKDALGKAAPPAPSEVRPDLGPQPPDANTIKEIEKLTNRFQAQDDKLRQALDTLRQYRDAVAEFPNAFKVSVDEVDKAIDELERRVSGTTDLQKDLWIGAAEASRNAITEFLIDPLNTSFKDLARGVVQTLQRIVAEAIAAQAVLAALNFVQGFTSFAIPGATRTPLPAGSALGGDAIGGQPRLVGERGPEVIIPASRSKVITTDQLAGGGGNMGAVQAEIRMLAQAVASQQAPTVVNINEQDPEGLLAVNRTRKGVREQRNFVTTDARKINRTLGRR